MPFVQSTLSLLLALLALVLLPLAACEQDPEGEAGGEGEKKAAEAITVKVGPVTQGAISAVYSTSTTLRAEQQATIIARTQGVVRALEVEEGARVGAGQVVARLEDEEQTITHARAQLTAEARAREAERQAQLRARDLISDVELEQSRTAAEDAAQAAALAKLNLERTLIRAPFSGVILKRHVDVGAAVGDGTALYDLADTSPLLAEVRVPERHVATLSAGQEATLTADATGAVAKGRIDRIAPFVDPTSGTVKVTLAALDGDGLRPGAFVKVDIVTETRPTSLIVPRSALVAEGRRWHVFVLSADRAKVSRQEVQLGFEEGDRVEILPVDAAAVPAGALVVTVGAPALSDGSDVRLPTETPTPKPAAEGATAGSADVAP